HPHRGPHAWSRAGPSVLLGSGRARALLRRPGAEGHHDLDTVRAARRSCRLSRLARAGAAPAAGATAARAWADSRRSRDGAAPLYRTSPGAQAADRRVAPTRSDDGRRDHRRYLSRALGVAAADGAPGCALAPRQAATRRPRPPRRRGVAYDSGMNQVVDF